MVKVCKRSEQTRLMSHFSGDVALVRAGTKAPQTSFLQELAVLRYSPVGLFQSMVPRVALKLRGTLLE